MFYTYYDSMTSIKGIVLLLLLLLLLLFDYYGLRNNDMRLRFSNNAPLFFLTSLVTSCPFIGSYYEFDLLSVYGSTTSPGNFSFRR